MNPTRGLLLQRRLRRHAATAASLAVPAHASAHGVAGPAGLVLFVGIPLGVLLLVSAGFWLAARWRAFVAEEEGQVVGYAYGSSHRERAAYRWSVETTVYVKHMCHRAGIGRALYRDLLPALAQAGFCNAYAGVALPNAASLALHRAVGFKDIGTFPRVGFKQGSWRDVAWLHRSLREQPPG